MLGKFASDAPPMFGFVWILVSHRLVDLGKMRKYIGENEAPKSENSFISICFTDVYFSYPASIYSYAVNRPNVYGVHLPT